jgi:hypothetical protein
MHHKWIAAAGIAAAMLWAPSAPAQADHSRLVPSGPAMDAAALSPRLALPSARSTSVTDATSAARPLRTSEILMIVGGAAIVTGALVGDDAGTVIIIGGAAVGLYGLYLFLQEQRVSGGRPSVGIGYRYRLRR